MKTEIIFGVLRPIEFYNLTSKIEKKRHNLSCYLGNKLLGLIIFPLGFSMNCLFFLRRFNFGYRKSLFESFSSHI